MNSRLGGFALGLITLVAPVVVHADEPDTQVARTSYTGGDVSYQRGDNDGWNALGVNTPLVTGDSLYTADDGRAEVALGGGNVLRMDTGTQVDLLSNTHDMSQLGLRSGYLSLRARAGAGGATVEVDTPNGAATVIDPGVYRFEMSDRIARYSVVKGKLSVALTGQQLDVEAGETLTIEGDDNPKYSFGPIAAQNQFDTWAHDRDLRAERAASARYVHHDVVGYEDLDGNGTWRDTSEYGRVWMPTGVSADWAPYQAGRWTWQDPYGWTWVSSESWGWAPYHYGRWVNVSGSWGWVPPPPMGYRGPAVVAEIRPVYAPALVAFIGGKNWSVGVSLGGGPSVGWVPLAPREQYYYPWQPAPQVTNNYTYTNITVNNAVTVVSTTNFSQGPVRPIHVPPGQLKHAPRMGYTATEIVPTHESLCPSEPRDARSRYVPHRTVDRPLVVRTAPPPKPVPFHDKVVEIQRTGRPFDEHDRGRHEGWTNHDDRNNGNARNNGNDRNNDNDRNNGNAQNNGNGHNNGNDRNNGNARNGGNERSHGDDQNVANAPHVGDDRNYRVVTAQPAKSMNQDAAPQPERRHRDDAGMSVAQSEASRGSHESNPPNGPSHPEHGATQSPSSPSSPADHGDRQARNDDRHGKNGNGAAQPPSTPSDQTERQARNDDRHGKNNNHHAAPAAQKEPAPAPDPRPIAANTPASTPDNSRGHEAEPPREPVHGNAKPAAANPGSDKSSPAKSKDEKGKGKDKDKSGHDGKSQG